jgi:hypothetical protein
MVSTISELGSSDSGVCSGSGLRGGVCADGKRAEFDGHSCFRCDDLAGAVQVKAIGAAACIGTLVVCAGCVRRNAHVPQAGTIVTNDNSYTDLKRGSRLSVLVPLVKSGGTQPTLRAQQSDGNRITLSAADLTGYEVAYYTITGGRNGAVRLNFTSAEITKDGKTVPEANPPALPFALPGGTEHIRLVYLVRVSQADHNMAVIASKHLEALNSFTAQLKKDPGVCKRDSEVFCSWVPAGVAVRQEAVNRNGSEN